MTVYGYCRVSTDNQEDGTSLESQTGKIAAMAQLAGLDAPIMFEDVCSGAIPLDQREGGAALLAALKPGDCVIVAKLDRCFRNAGDALSRSDWFRANGIDLYLIDMGSDPVTQNGTSRMFFGMLALVAEFERERIRERTADGRAAKKAKGGHIGGSRPFGYEVIGTGKDAVLRPLQAEQEAIAAMREMRDAGASLRAISAAMAERGHRISHEGVAKALARA